MKRGGPLKRSPMKRKTPGSKSDFPQSVRDELRRRTGGRCQFPNCAREWSHAHHILPRRQGGMGTLDNALGLCLDHHAYVHANPAESYENDWLRRSGPVTM
jgi:hypothetical protein